MKGPKFEETAIRGVKFGKYCEVDDTELVWRLKKGGDFTEEGFMQTACYRAKKLIFKGLKQKLLIYERYRIFF